MLEAYFLNGTVIPFNLSAGASLGRGATAVVHSVIVGDQRFAAKIYNKDHSFDAEKILSMCSMGYPFGLPTNTFAWPLAAIRSNGDFCGYLMLSFEKADHYPLSYYFDSTFFKKLITRDLLSLSNRVEIARSLCCAIAEIHSIETYLVDLKPQNILVSWKKNNVALLDCDGFSFKNSNGHRFPAGHISTDYICPEAIKEKMSPSTLGCNQDNYALGVILFQLFNYAQHPFQGTVIDRSFQYTTNDEHAAAGLYPYGLIPSKYIIPRKGSTHSCMPNKLCALFDRTFEGTAADRVSAVEWLNYFSGVIEKKKLKRCDQQPNNPNHIHFIDGQCPECLREKAKEDFKKQASLKVKPAADADIRPNEIASKPHQSHGRKPNGRTGRNALIAIVISLLFLAYIGSEDPPPSGTKPANPSNLVTRPITPNAPNNLNNLSQIPIEDIVSVVKSNLVNSTNGQTATLMAYLPSTLPISSITKPGLFIIYRSCEPSTAEIQKAQRSLRLLGFKVGIIDGVFGPATSIAIREFQRSKSIPLSGQLDLTTAKHLKVDVASYNFSNFKFHSRGTVRSSKSGPAIEFYGVAAQRQFCFYVSRR